MPSLAFAVMILPIKDVTFVVAVNQRHVLEGNFLSSPCLHAVGNPQILLQEGFESAAKAYNDAIGRSKNDLIIFIHQDVVLPQRWLLDLAAALERLNVADPGWGVLGCYGEGPNAGGIGYVYSSGLGIVGAAFERPTPVQTLDEIVLIVRKSSGLRFDERLPHFHFYGTDICLRAAKMGLSCYAISAFCIHNTCQPLVLPKEFYECCRYVRRVWKDWLPIQTSCIKITKYNLPIYTRRLRELYLRYIRRKECGGKRASDALGLLNGLTSSFTDVD
jgi:GT2 family glycosyltransferase